MKMYYYFLFFLGGSILGSFYNVLGLRIPKGESVVSPRSHCPYCYKTLSWYELIPIFSYLFLKGKCKSCQANISIFYPFVEFSTGLLFLVAYHSFGFSYNLLIALILISTFMVIIVSDLNYLIIPDRFIVIPSILIFIIKILDQGITTGIMQLLYGLISFSLMYLVMILGNHLFKKESLGGADIKLMFLIGLTLDPLLAVFVIFLASITALPVSLFLLVKNKEHVIPYGPFLMLGLLIVYFTKLNIQEVFEKLLSLFS